MPIKNIIPGQTVTKEKLQRAKELRRDTTPAEKTRSVWQEFRFGYLDAQIRKKNSLASFAFLSDDIPPILSRRYSQPAQFELQSAR